MFFFVAFSYQISYQTAWILPISSILKQKAQVGLAGEFLFAKRRLHTKFQKIS